MSDFVFNPPEGLGNKISFPTNPASEEEARQQFMTLFNQIKDFMNTNVRLNTGGQKGDNWWIKDEATGLIRQGGIGSINFSNSDYANVTINFPIPFKSKINSITGTEKGNTITTTGMFNIACTWNSLDKFVAQSCVLNQVPRTGTLTFSWEATGF